MELIFTDITGEVYELTQIGVQGNTDTLPRVLDLTDDIFDQATNQGGIRTGGATPKHLKLFFTAWHNPVDNNVNGTWHQDLIKSSSFNISPRTTALTIEYKDLTDGETEEPGYDYNDIKLTIDFIPAPAP